jgi:hypothetical protein
VAHRAEGWRLSAYVGAVMGVIGIVAYSTGWGPILSLGFIFGAASYWNLRRPDWCVPVLVRRSFLLGLLAKTVEGFIEGRPALKGNRAGS